MWDRPKLFRHTLEDLDALNRSPGAIGVGLAPAARTHEDAKMEAPLTHRCHTRIQGSGNCSVFYSIPGERLEPCVQLWGPVNALFQAQAKDPATDRTLRAAEPSAQLTNCL